MHGDGPAFPLLLHVGAADRELVHHPPILPHLADPQAEQLGDAKPGLEAQDEPGPVSKGVGPAETPTHQGNLRIRQGPTAFHRNLQFYHYIQLPPGCTNRP
jgi:hypothetical protein